MKKRLRKIAKLYQKYNNHRAKSRLRMEQVLAEIEELMRKYGQKKDAYWVLHPATGEPALYRCDTYSAQQIPAEILELFEMQFMEEEGHVAKQLLERLND